MIRYFKIVFLLLLLQAGCTQENRDPFRDRQQDQQVDLQPDTSRASTVAAPDATTVEEEPGSPATPAGDKVVAVKDGDTMELLRNGQTITVRLYGIDSPEKNQDYGQRAKQYASDLAFGKYVKLIPHNTDRYGRTVGTIVLPDGRSLNEEMVKNGFAWHYKAYSKDKNLENLEADARRFKRGLWNVPNPTPPWDFRKNKSSNAQPDAQKSTAPASTPLPPGASKRTVYLCDSKGSAVYHVSTNCSVLKRCKAEVITTTEAAAIRDYNRRLDKTCGS